jgi:Amiloride-sensitive sodium channel
MSISEFLAAIGGLGGLVAGVSLISIIELVSFVVFKVIKKIATRKSAVHPDTASKVFTLLNQKHTLYKLTEYIIEFIKASNIHGIGFVINKDLKLIVRIFWAIIVFISTLSCGFLIKDSIDNSEQHPYTVAVDERIWKVGEVKVKVNFEIENLLKSS